MTARSTMFVWILVAITVLISVPLFWAFHWAWRTDSQIMDQRAAWIYATDYQSLSTSIREFAWGSAGFQTHGRDEVWMLGDTNVPAMIWRLMPSGLRVDDEKAELWASGAYAPFSLRIYRKGLIGTGLVNVADGVWFSAEDGRIPKDKRRSPNHTPGGIPTQFAFITTNTTLQQVIDRVGKYDRVRGSGILRYEYDLRDGSAVLLSPDWPFSPTNRIRGVRFYQSAKNINLYP